MINRIQKQIEDIYKIRTYVRVEDYLITKETCETMLRKASGVTCSRGSKGFVFLCQAKDELNLAVYLDKDVLSTLFKPSCLIYKELTNFFIAIEEISHFVYAVWNALRDRQITRFEMELQAEVDKYITSLLYYKNLKDNIFYNFSYHDTLSSEEIKRYRRANRIAFKYCNFLETEFIKNNYFSRLIRDIRTFYRLTHGSKVDYVRQMTA